MIIPFHRAHITEVEIEGVTDSLRKGWLTMGGKTVEFENRFAGFVGAANAVAVNSCTAALHLALKAIGLGEGDEVIMPVMTFVATAETVLYFNARPVFIDVDRDNHLIKTEEIEKHLTSKTKAIIPVHYGGQPADLDEILALAGKDIRVIEDAAHAFPAKYRGRNIGKIGDITCFSFYATKTLTTGEGGMAVTENNEWAERMRRLRLHGITSDAWKRYSSAGTWKYDVEEVGYKYNTTDLNSAIGLAQLDKCESLLNLRKTIAERYDSAFRDVKGISTCRVKPDRDSAWHLYPVRLEIESLQITRDEFIEEMKNRGISTSVHFIPVCNFTYYQKAGIIPEDYPDAQWLFQRMVSLPVYPSMTEEESEYVIDNVIDIVSRNLK